MLKYKQDRPQCKQHLDPRSLVKRNVRNTWKVSRIMQKHLFQGGKGLSFAGYLPDQCHLVAGRSCRGHWNFNADSMLTCDSKACWLKRQWWIRQINWKKSGATPWGRPQTFETSKLRRRRLSWAGASQMVFRFGSDKELKISLFLHDTDRLEAKTEVRLC